MPSMSLSLPYPHSENKVCLMCFSASRQTVFCGVEERRGDLNRNSRDDYPPYLTTEWILTVWILNNPHISFKFLIEKAMPQIVFSLHFLRIWEKKRKGEWRFNMHIAYWVKHGFRLFIHYLLESHTHPEV